MVDDVDFVQPGDGEDFDEEGDCFMSQPANVLVGKVVQSGERASTPVADPGVKPEPIQRSFSSVMACNAFLESPSDRVAYPPTTPLDATPTAQGSARLHASTTAGALSHHRTPATPPVARSLANEMTTPCSGSRSPSPAFFGGGGNFY